MTMRFFTGLTSEAKSAVDAISRKKRKVIFRISENGFLLKNIQRYKNVVHPMVENAYLIVS
jgi:hypothetical protein